MFFLRVIVRGYCQRSVATISRQVPDAFARRWRRGRWVEPRSANSCCSHAPQKCGWNTHRHLHLHHHGMTETTSPSTHRRIRPAFFRTLLGAHDKNASSRRILGSPVEPLEARLVLSGTALLDPITLADSDFWGISGYGVSARPAISADFTRPSQVFDKRHRGQELRVATPGRAHAH